MTAVFRTSVLTTHCSLIGSSHVVLVLSLVMETLLLHLKVRVSACDLRCVFIAKYPEVDNFIIELIVTEFNFMETVPAVTPAGGSLVLPTDL